MAGAVRSVGIALLLLLGAADAGVWPQPKSATGGGSRAVVWPSVRFFSAGTSSVGRLLREAFARYGPIAFPHGEADAEAPAGAITGLDIFIEDASEDHPQLDTDESYSLLIPQPSLRAAANATEATARAHCKTVYGALRALETFSQLVTFDFDAGGYTMEAPLQIEDNPRFPHRGLMIDTGRHYLSMASIRAIVESLPYAKLNVLHWHMVDTQAFPYQSTSRPRLWEGAFSPAERYTQGDIAALVDFARLRGVRVMVEFDVPGHAQSWCKGYPEVCPSASCTQPLNVASEATFGLLDGLLEEVTGGQRSSPGRPSGLFPDDFVHLGGDEVDTTCWKNSPEISAWLRDRNMSMLDGYKYFVNRAAESVIKRGRRPVQWDEVYDNFKDALPKGSIVHVWKDNTNVTEVVARGFNVLRNVGYNKISWYLDNLNVKWDAVYRNEPCEGVPTDALCDMVLGGHGEMWGEGVDASDLQQTVWPKLAAIAEKLWSPRAATQDAAKARPRIGAFRCLLMERGVAAAPVDNAMARSGPAGPGSCLQGSTSDGLATSIFT